MVLWVDKYRPQSLSKLELHADINERLQRLVDCADFPHLLFYGPSGAGKKTRIGAVLRAVFGAGASKVRVLTKVVKLRGSRVVEIATLQSNYHIELTPSEAGNSDRQVIQEVIKELAQTTNVATSVLSMTAGGGGEAAASSSSSSSPGDKAPKQFKVVILNEVDRLSMAAQQALRRTMEKYTYTSAAYRHAQHLLLLRTQPPLHCTHSLRVRCCVSVSRCRLILVCESLSKVIPPLRSRCLPIRVSAPQVEEIKGILQHIAHKEDIVLHDRQRSALTAAFANIVDLLPPHVSLVMGRGVLRCAALALQIAEDSGRNLRKAILMLEACSVKQSAHHPTHTVREPLNCAANRCSVCCAVPRCGRTTAAYSRGARTGRTSSTSSAASSCRNSRPRGCCSCAASCTSCSPTAYRQTSS